MKDFKSQMLLLINMLVIINISQFSNAQTIDTAYFTNSNQPLEVRIEGNAFTTNAHISRVVKSTNGADSVIIGIYWKHCLPAFNSYEPYDTTITLDLTTPSTFNVRIDSYKDTNTIANCSLKDSVELLFHYNMPNNIANIEMLELEEKRIVKIVNLMGNEVEDTLNTLLIYIFSDGTRKKVFNVN